RHPVRPHRPDRPQLRGGAQGGDAKSEVGPLVTNLTAPFGASGSACGIPERSALMGKVFPRTELCVPGFHDFSTPAQATSASTAFSLPGPGVVCGDGRGRHLSEEAAPTVTAIEGSKW